MKNYQCDYEWNSEYCYPNSTVLINKLNIQDANALSVAEREITSLRLALAKATPIKGCFDFAHLRKLHQFIFGDIYEWAGESRRVNIAKGNQFCLAQNIDRYAGNLFQKLQKVNYLIGTADVPIRLAYFLSEINVLHPFREGNGRTQRLFIEYLAGVAGYRADFSSVSAKEMIVASANSFALDYRDINSMFLRITSPISPIGQKAKIKLFFGTDSQQHKQFMS